MPMSEPAPNKYTTEDLREMQGWSLERKIQVTQTRILEWYIKNNGNVYVSFSGGKDSTQKKPKESRLTLITLAGINIKRRP